MLEEEVEPMSVKSGTLNPAVNDHYPCKIEESKIQPVYKPSVKMSDFTLDFKSMRHSKTPDRVKQHKQQLLS